MEKILLGYDGSEYARRALELAATLAGNGATITVLRAVSPQRTSDPESIELLKGATERLAERGVTARIVERNGDAGSAIVEEAREWGADLIVVGTRGRNLAERLLLGSVSTKVVHHAPCNVLVVR